MNLVLTCTPQTKTLSPIAVTPIENVPLLAKVSIAIQRNQPSGKDSILPVKPVVAVIACVDKLKVTEPPPPETFAILNKFEVFAFTKQLATLLVAVQVENFTTPKPPPVAVNLSAVKLPSGAVVCHLKLL
jgi:hypothetical protein